MNNIPPKPQSMSSDLYNLCLSITSKRPKTIILHILQYGSITTEEINEIYGYDHPPRAVRDVRENGIPLETFSVVSNKTGRKIAAYRFADPSKAIAGRLGGRKIFSKQFKDLLISYYGERSTLTNENIEARYLQIDHRIPYEIAGNNAGEDIHQYMLLDASSQREKSWSCEQCINFQNNKDINICSSCFWAFPENYTHIAMREERRITIIWNEDEIIFFNNLVKIANSYNISLQRLIKNILLQSCK